MYLGTIKSVTKLPFFFLSWSGCLFWFFFFLVVNFFFNFGKNSKGIETLSGNRKHPQLLWICGQPALAHSLISSILNGKKLLLFQVSVCVFCYSCHGTGKTDMFCSCLSCYKMWIFFSALYLQHNSVCSSFPYLTKVARVGVTALYFFLFFIQSVLLAHLWCTRVSSSLVQPLNFGYSIA